MFYLLENRHSSYLRRPASFIYTKAMLPLKRQTSCPETLITCARVRTCVSNDRERERQRQTDRPTDRQTELFPLRRKKPSLDSSLTSRHFFSTKKKTCQVFHFTPLCSSAACPCLLSFQVGRKLCILYVYILYTRVCGRHCACLR